MRINDREAINDHERLTVVPETIDDLWHLQYVLELGDWFSGETTRRIQRTDETLRDTGGEREPMYVTLDVEEVSFHKFANRLRVSGVITECSREDQLGHHHTINVEPYQEFTIEKSFKPDQLDRLEEAEAARENPDVAIATIEEGQAHVHTLSQAGTDEYVSITGPTGKGEFARDRSELFADLARALSYLDVDAILLAGPGFTKNDAYDYVERTDPELTEIITVVDTSAVGDRGVHEVLKRGVVDDLLAETRIATEAELIDELMQRIKTGETAVYGPEHVRQAAEYGAIETVLLLDDRLRAERNGEGSWEIDADEIIETVEQQGGDVVVFSSDFDPGRQLEGLGGIAALLRYRIT